MWFSVSGLGFRVQDVKLMVQGLGFRVQGQGLGVWDLGFGFCEGWCSGCGKGEGWRFRRLRFRVEDSSV